MRLAVLGMGRMGRAVAECLLGGGHDIVIWNRTPHMADDLVADGVRQAATPAAAARETDATFTLLADDAAVRSVVTGPDGAASGLGAGVLIDASTVSPETTAHLADALGGRLLASPILGSPAAVVARDAAYLIGGPRELYDRLHPAYDALADERNRRYLGGDATVATTLKLLSNYLLMPASPSSRRPSRLLRRSGCPTTSFAIT
jgi:3-hydroxyisobutyrate dehydrogenase-like beta-hydroxyacid dehydrogenase